MISKKILGLSVAAVFAVGVMGSPLYADAIADLVKTSVTVAGDNYDEIVFTTADKVPRKGAFGGYAILTDGHVVAVTSHQGFYDSETQKGPLLEPALPISDTAAACVENDRGCGGVWHTHLVEPTGSDLCATGLAVGALTFEEPSEKVKVKAKQIALRDIPLGTSEFTESLSNTAKDFTVGLPIDSDLITGASTPFNFDGVSFDLTPTFDGEPSAETLVVCIGPLAEE